VQEAEDVVTLDNGCVCCTVRGDLVSSPSADFNTAASAVGSACLSCTDNCSEGAHVGVHVDDCVSVDALGQVKALLGFADKRKVFDCILIETTGLADPSPIVR
jgi:CobW/HypB/UreG, nucleotide-binding domain